MMEIFKYSFMQHALISGAFIGVSCSFLGVFLVLRRLSLIGDGLAHVSFAAIALGLLLGLAPGYVSIPLVMAASLAILKLSRKAGVYADAAIGVLSSLGIATGVIIVSVSGGFNADLFSYLFGNILTISFTDVIFTIVLSVCVVLAVCFFYHDLFLITFNEELAAVSGINIAAIDRIFMLLAALTVGLGIRVVGTLLVSCLIVLPAVTALQVARSFRSALVLAALAAVSSVFAGIIVSYWLNLPAGATIAYANLAEFLLVFIFRRLFYVKKSV
jgi:zinc transport system permease protein